MWAVAVALAGAPPDLGSVERTTRSLAAPLMAEGVLHHVVVGVLTPQGAGVWALDGGPADSVHELGGLTTGVTGLLLADAIGRGELSIDATLDEALGLTAPARDGRRIALTDLATHTSGLPRLPASFDPVGNPAIDPRDPYAWTTPDALRAELTGAALIDRPGSAWETSPFGMALLGAALERATGRPLPALVQERVARPLQMGSLGYDGVAVQGHDVDGRPVGPWSTGAWPGATGLRASVPDLLSLVGVALTRTGPLAPAVATASGTQRDLGAAGGVGFGWQVAVDGTVWQNGQTGGHHGLVAWHPARGIGVVVLGDTACDAVDQLGFAVLQALAGQAPGPLPVRAVVPVEPRSLDGWVGSWAGPDGTSLAVRRDGDALVLVRPGRPDRVLHAASATTRFLRDGSWEATLDGRRLLVRPTGAAEQVWRRP